MGLELQKLIFQCLASYGFVGDKIVCLHRGQSVRNGQKIVRGDKFVLLTENGVYKTKKWQENTDSTKINRPGHNIRMY